MARKTPITAGVEAEQLNWLDNQPEPNAELVRRGIDELMQKRNGN